MKRNLARRINECNTEINKKLELTQNNERDIGDKLIKGENLTLENIKYLGQRLAQNQQYNENQVEVCQVQELSQRLKLHDTDDLDRDPVFVICRSENDSTITFCIFKHEGKIYCLYNDFTSVDVSKSIKETIERIFGQNIEFEVNESDGIEDQGDSSLVILETMMIELRSDKKSFIRSFKSCYNLIKDKIANVKKHLFSVVKDNYDRTFRNDIDQLSKEEEFKHEINKFLDNIPLDKVKYFKKYQKLLEDLVDMDESEVDNETIKRLDEAKNEAFSNVTENIDQTTGRLNDNMQLDIVNRFPNQMRIFTSIFEPLAKSDVDEYLEKTLKEISSKLDLDYEKIKCFFVGQREKTQKKKETSPFIVNIEDIETNSVNQCDDVMDENYKSLPQLLLEIRFDNEDKIDAKLLEDGYHKVKENYHEWQSKNLSEIYEWAKLKKKSKLTDTEIHEAIAVMDRANRLVKGHKLRDTQILSVLVMLRDNSKGQLSQIQTGEGKTTIVSILAAIKALQGQAVDIITSSPVLADDAVKDKQQFYNLFNLTVATNNLDENYKSGERECYKYDVVYGCISNFQFDFLKDTFLGLGTRSRRSFGTIILDEVDSMIIDNASHIAKLSENLPGMETLKYVYIKIWQELEIAEKIVVEQLQENFKRTFTDFKARNLSEQDRNEFENFINKIENSIIPKIKDHIKNSNPTEIDFIPSHIIEYANSTLDRWIDSAINAKYIYQEDEQYVIRQVNNERVIQPVDYANTGITLKNTIWQYGLHQFLQLKHNLRLTSETLTSCFISNLGYINKYGSKIFGLTGTLGSKAERELFSLIYNVDFSKIPTYREKVFEEFEGEVIHDDKFCLKIAYDALLMTDNNRASLIICETIKDAKIINQYLTETNQNVTIKTFFDEGNVHITEEEITPGQIVIATNIAGRGTDFKTSHLLESYGGLHVVVAFLPCNKRVEDQAFGRTARQGNRGSAQIVVRSSQVEKLGIGSENFDQIKQVRDKQEIERIQVIKQSKIKELEFLDKLFERFSNLYRKLSLENQNRGYYTYVLHDLKELWAFWLEKRSYKGSQISKISLDEEFRDFKMDAQENIGGKIKFNPYYSVQQAEYFISHGNLNNAEKSLQRAIEITENFQILHSAYFKLFEIEIEKGKVFLDKFKEAIGDIFPILNTNPERHYKENAKKYLLSAIDAIRKEQVYIESLFENNNFPNIIQSDENDSKDDAYWFTGEDMRVLGKATFNAYGVDANIQFINRLTYDQIEFFCKNYKLEKELPVFVCYNIGSEINRDSGEHWVSICIVKYQQGIKILYKDSKGDFMNNKIIIKEEFQHYYENVDFIAHTTSEQTNNSSCGPMAFENLKIIAESIQNNGLQHVIDNFTDIEFCKERDAMTVRNKLIHLSPKETLNFRNLFLKHIISRQQALYLYINHAEGLFQQIHSHSDGISICGRVNDYFANLKPQNDHENKIKETITDCELFELAAVGTNTTYVLREVYDVCPEIVNAARSQIIGGIVLIGTGICFPPALPFTGSMGGTMITEGICDVANEIINQNSDGKFHTGAYVKGKVISYGISLLTMGINAALQCPKILEKAKEACRWVSLTLRQCRLPFLKEICEFLATKFDRLAVCFDKFKTLAEYSKLSNAGKIEYLNGLINSKQNLKLNYLGIEMKNVEAMKESLLTVFAHSDNSRAIISKLGINVAKSVAIRSVESVIMGKIVAPLLESFMSDFKRYIMEHVKKAVEENINQIKLKFSSYEQINNIIKEIKETIDFETVKDIFKEAILGITKYCNDWRLQLSALLIDQYCCWNEVYNYAKTLCKKINDKLISNGTIANENIEKMMDRIVLQLSDEIFYKVISNSVKTALDCYSVGRSALSNYKRDKEYRKLCLVKNESFKKGGQTGQEQANAMSDALKRTIHIYESNGNVVIIGEQYLGKPIELDYYAHDENTGHYVPRGKNKNWSYDNMTNNNCFFHAVGYLTNKNPNVLRDNTIKRIESHPDYYMTPYVGEDILMKGGEPQAYGPNCTPEDAKKLLDGSQGVSSEAQRREFEAKRVNKSESREPGNEKAAKPPVGHPRAHALIRENEALPEKQSDRIISCAQEVTKKYNCKKTAFDSKQEQDRICNELLKTKASQEAIERLNHNSLEEVVHVPTKELKQKVMIQTVKKGNVMDDRREAKSLTIVLGHHEGQVNNPEAPVHIKTSYGSFKETKGHDSDLPPTSDNKDASKDYRRKDVSYKK